MELRCSAIDSLRAVPPGLTEQYTERELRCMHAARSYLGGGPQPPDIFRHGVPPPFWAASEGCPTRQTRLADRERDRQ